MGKFNIQKPFEPAGDQPKAIASLTNGLNTDYKNQTLLGVTGSGKTFTLANVIQNVQRPTLVIAHNKTLAAQLASEFRQFFPENAVHYFVSYYDYYQPEAYIPTTDTYIEKDSSINDEIDRLRNAATQALMTRRDVIIVASVSCIYGLGSPDVYRTAAIPISVGENFGRHQLIRRLTDILYERNDYELSRGKFRVKGDVIEIFPAYDEQTYRITFFGDTIENISAIDPVSAKGQTFSNSKRSDLSQFEIFPAKHFLTEKNDINGILAQMEADMEKEVVAFTKEGRLIEAQRLRERTTFDIEMIRETGVCSGIENYSRYFDRRAPGSPPSVLLDYFPTDYLLMIDESHMTIPQLRGMYNGDKARKDTLIHYGFRLQAARDNRPLTFEEFNARVGQTIYVSATPSECELALSTRKNRITNYELRISEKNEENQISTKNRNSYFVIHNSPPEQSGDSQLVETPAFTPDGVVEQIIRPTGLVDPIVEVRPTANQVDDLINEIRETVKLGQRVLVTTLTKRMSEDLTEYLIEIGIKVQYLHSDVETLERTEILRDLRAGQYDVLVGINLLREGLDLPEVSLVAILDADREGFLRNGTSLIQTFGRAARHINGRVIMYGDTITKSMQIAIDETGRRRKIQIEYNQSHGITPKSIVKTVPVSMRAVEVEPEGIDFSRLPKDEIKKMIKRLEVAMDIASKNLEFEKAAELRDKISDLRKFK